MLAKRFNQSFNHPFKHVLKPLVEKKPTEVVAHAIRVDLQRHAFACVAWRELSSTGSLLSSSCMGA
jgi:hypothetical protein